MYKTFSTSIILALFLALSPINKAVAQNNETIAQTVVHLLSYVSKDYAVAVQDGKIISKAEYAEQVEFVTQAYKMTKTGSFLSGQEKESVIEQIKKLDKYVTQKLPAPKISGSADNIINKIIKFTGLKTAPKLWPDLQNGMALYAKNCAICHGKNGNGRGPGSKALSPKPTNFQDVALMKNLSPYQAFSSIKLGVPGTAMTAYDQLSKAEKWDLAFYIKSLRFRNTPIDSTKLRKAFKTANSNINLEQVATLSDHALIDTLNKLTSNAQTSLRALRLLAPVGKLTTSSLSVAKTKLKAALKNYTQGKASLAHTQAISAYLEGVEPVEAQLKTQDADFMLALETKMFNVRQAIAKDKGKEVVQTKINAALAAITKAEDLLGSGHLNYWLTFIISASIMLREGLEAFLILAVVLALIKKAKAKKALPWLHGGWITAVICGIAGWFLSDYILQFGGKNREIMEGLVALFAVAVLLFAGFWLHNKTHAKQWADFIKNKIGGYLKKDRMLGLAAFSFMVVFREAFEVVLFLQAVSLEASPANQSAIGLGVIAAVICIAAIAFAFLKYSKMIPVRKVFLYSSWVILLLAIILVGKGFHALQESGWINISDLSAMFRIEWLGIYPTVQTVTAQLVLISIIGITYLVNKQRHKKLVVQEK